ncbi:divalent metal cation transporter [Desulfovibrio aerotolerans]|uniref:Divalent metal cation transporter n=1 Tax=Solidesulfovibrio aerotolerans TaxID=295255 RepID=A0A7C9IU71_9BACT|nr:Nramp family divalent metal transporter [Solidesulfovibrio aerotolerans]MYL83220.1 divalent metal cation transporter [Solidesulfovibrio aerotolerans]
MPFFKKFSRKNFMLFFALLGPGIITANVDNDAGGITTYSLAGARYGYSLLWMLIPTTISLVVIQEMCARMGAVTGKGLSDLIRESFGLRITFYIMIALFLTNLGNTISEFAGIAAGMELFGVTKFLSVPLAATLVWLLIVKGSYRIVERVFLIVCVVYLVYPLAALSADVPWGEVARASVTPSFRADGDYIAMMIALIGTTIAPWMQFYQQAAVVEKGITAENYAFTRLDVVIGCILAVIVALFIVVACAASIHRHGLPIETAADAAMALKPLVGQYASWLFGVGLINASLFAAGILPLSTAYYICEAMGWELGIDKDFRRAPEFFWLFTISIVIGAATILIPGMPLLFVMYVSQVVNGVVLPFVLILMLLLINNKRLMGKFVNGPVFNAVAWATVAALIGLTALMTIDTIRPGAINALVKLMT